MARPRYALALKSQGSDAFWLKYPEGGCPLRKGADGRQGPIEIPRGPKSLSNEDIRLKYPEDHQP